MKKKDKQQELGDEYSPEEIVNIQAQLVIGIGEAIQWYESLTMGEQLAVLLREYLRQNDKEIEGIDPYKTDMEIVVGEKALDAFRAHEPEQEKQDEPVYGYGNADNADTYIG